jgi:hypothetical protein
MEQHSIISRIESDPVDNGSGDQENDSDEAHYRLSHDVLVTPLKAWLARKPADVGITRDEPTTDEHIPRTIGFGPISRMARRFETANGPREMRQLIDINWATEDELKTLPGIGPKIARRMIEGRPYGKVDDLLRVKGMSGTRLSEIRPLIVLG